MLQRSSDITESHCTSHTLEAAASTVYFCIRFPGLIYSVMLLICSHFLPNCPLRVRYGVSLVSLKYDLCLLLPSQCGMWYHDKWGLCYTGTRLKQQIGISSKPHSNTLVAEPFNSWTFGIYSQVKKHSFAVSSLLEMPSDTTLKGALILGFCLAGN